jgi:hypothetical protein
MPMPTAEDTLALHLDELECVYIRQYRYAGDRKLKGDFAVWPLTFENDKLLVEVQGGIFSRQAHGSLQGIKRDLDRAQQACLNGWYWLPVTPQQVEDGTAKEMVRKWLEG